MRISGERIIPASPETVWNLMLDQQTLLTAIPGCENLDRVSDTEFEAAVTIKVGPVKAKFAGKVELSELDEPKSCALSGQGNGGVAGFAKGNATITLSSVGEGCLLAYAGNIDIGGKIAGIGDRLFKGVVEKNVDYFFSQIVSAAQPAS
jgi:carbon monoxide dehydrogenase subunit G